MLLILVWNQNGGDRESKYENTFGYSPQVRCVPKPNGHLSILFQGISIKAFKFKTNKTELQFPLWIYS